MNLFSVRLESGDDLKNGIENFARSNSIKAGFIITAVGSLSCVSMRLAGAKPNKQTVKSYKGEYEIVSLVGTISVSGNHIHISVSDKTGQVTGGHLKVGTIINTTAEIVIGEDTNKIFKRKLDPNTGFEELFIEE